MKVYVVTDGDPYMGHHEVHGVFASEDAAKAVSGTLILGEVEEFDLEETNSLVDSPDCSPVQYPKTPR